MDRAVCHMEAQNEVGPTQMVRLLKRRFPELDGVSKDVIPLSRRLLLTILQYVIPFDAIERRIETLELQENDYFKPGMEAAVADAEASGLVLPDYDPANYPGRKFERKSDLEVYGSGSPMSGVLGYGASNVPESENLTRGIGKLSLGDRSKPNGQSKSPEDQLNARNDPSTRRVQLGTSSHRHVRSISTDNAFSAGEYVQVHNLTNIANTGNSVGLPSPLPAPTSDLAMKAATTPLPATPVNAQSNQFFSTPSSKNKHLKSELTTLPSTAYASTPSSKDKNRSKSDSSHARLATLNISAPSAKTGKAAAAGSSSGNLYRSGKENATSGMSSTTTGTSILGREVSGMSAALERRQQKTDQRATPDL